MASENPKPKFKHFIRFSLKGYLIVTLVSALVGYFVFHWVSVQGKWYLKSYLEKQYGITKFEFEYRTTDELYAEKVPEWYETYCVERPQGQDSVDLAMRRARQLNIEKPEESLPRIHSFRLPGDQLCAYQVAMGSEKFNAYAFLFRKDVLVFSAEKRHDDVNWVEKSAPMQTLTLLGASEEQKGVAIASGMTTVLGLSGLLLFGTALMRYTQARRRFKDRSAKHVEGPETPLDPQLV